MARILFFLKTGAKRNMIEFKTMDSAPKDHQYILLCEENGHVQIGTWSEHFQKWTDGGEGFDILPILWAPIPRPTEAQIVQAPRKFEYRGYFIEHSPPPIPSRAHDWAFQADGFDGAPDSGDNRCGTGPFLEDCKRQIDELEDGDQ